MITLKSVFNTIPMHMLIIMLTTSFLIGFVIEEGDATADVHLSYEAEYTITLNKEERLPISNYLIGFNLVYVQENQSVLTTLIHRKFGMIGHSTTTQ